MLQAESAPVSRTAPVWLAGIAVGTVLMWQFPFGVYVLYPFTILGTWFHEMGHGLAAGLLGAEFKRLEIFANGSGIATHSGDVYFGPFGRAFVAAAGPMGPPIAGALLIRLSATSDRAVRIALLLFAAALLVSVLVWIRSIVGITVILSLGAVILMIGLRPADGLQRFTLQFLGVQACVSTFRDFNYLFTPGGTIAGQTFASDTTVMSQHLILPYWIWGVVLALFSIYLLLRSLSSLARARPPAAV